MKDMIGARDARMELTQKTYVLLDHLDVLQAFSSSYRCEGQVWQKLWQSVCAVDHSDRGQ